jgi:hypothetical protein
MRGLPVLFVLVAILSIATAVQNWRYEGEESKEPKEHNFKTAPYKKTHKMTEQEENERMAAILEKIKNREGDEDIPEIMADLEKLVRLSPSTPKGVNFTAMVHQLENAVRENVTKMLELQMKSKDFSNMYSTGMMRYKRSNDTYWACINICSSIGQYGGGAMGATMGAALFSVVPVIGTMIGGVVGAMLGSSVGKSVATSAGKTYCPQ